MARRSEHSQAEIKRMVLDAAETIVVEEGAEALKVRKIAMEIGYTVGSIYMVFKNMADLIIHVKGRTLDDLAEQLGQVIEEPSPEENIKALALAYHSFACQHFNRWYQIFDSHLLNEEEVPDWYQQKVECIFSLVENEFKRLSSSANLAQSRLAARALWSGVHGVCVLSLTGKLDLLGGQDSENTVELLVDNFLKGWRQ